jgi:hypothetical protein
MFVNVTTLNLHGREKRVRLFVPSLVYHHAAGTEAAPTTALRLSDGQAITIAEPIDVFEARCLASLHNEPEPELAAEASDDTGPKAARRGKAPPELAAEASDDTGPKAARRGKAPPELAAEASDDA